MLWSSKKIPKYLHTHTKKGNSTMPRPKVENVRPFEGWYSVGDCDTCPGGRQPDGTLVKFNCKVVDALGVARCPPDTTGNPAGVFGMCRKHTCQGKDGPCHCHCSNISNYPSPCAKLGKPTAVQQPIIPNFG